MTAVMYSKHQFITEYPDFNIGWLYCHKINQCYGYCGIFYVKHSNPFVTFRFKHIFTFYNVLFPFCWMSINLLWFELCNKQNKSIENALMSHWLTQETYYQFTWMEILLNILWVIQVYNKIRIKIYMSRVKLNM